MQLLYGTDTPAGRAALSLISNLSNVIILLVDDLDVEGAREAFTDVEEAHRVFTQEARRALLTPSLRHPEGALSVREEAHQKAEDQAHRWPVRSRNDKDAWPT